MAKLYKALSTVTVGSGGAANIEFTSIPQTYTDLVIKASARVSSGGDDIFAVKINGVSTSVYTSRSLEGFGSSAYSYSSSSALGVPGGMNNGSATTASTFSNNDIYFANYTSSNNKSLSFDGVSENNATSAGANLTAGLATITNAITSIALSINGGANLAQYSTFTLYGIKNS